MYKRHLLQIAISVFSIIFMGFSAWAVPQTINYQGKLTDPNGISMNGIYVARFYLFCEEVNGNFIWSEQQDLTVTNGI